MESSFFMKIQACQKYYSRSSHGKNLFCNNRNYSKFIFTVASSLLHRTVDNNVIQFRTTRVGSNSGIWVNVFSYYAADYDWKYISLLAPMSWTSLPISSAVQSQWKLLLYPMALISLLNIALVLCNLLCCNRPIQKETL